MHWEGLANIGTCRACAIRAENRAGEKANKIDPIETHGYSLLVREVHGAFYRLTDTQRGSRHSVGPPRSGFHLTNGRMIHGAIE